VTSQSEDRNLDTAMSTSNTQNILGGKPEGKKSLGTPRVKFKENIKINRLYAFNSYLQGNTPMLALYVIIIY
jgi:hypothetical protein